MHSLSIENRFRTVELQDDLILYTMKSDGVTHYFNRNEALLHILMMDETVSYNSSSRLRITLMRNKRVYRWFVYDIALACYMGRISADIESLMNERFINELEAFKAYKAENNLTVDHLMDSPKGTNNTIWNLSLIDEKLNRQKNRIASRFNYPFAFCGAYVAGKYRLELIGNINKGNCERIFGDKLRRALKCRVTIESPVTIRHSFICNGAAAMVDRMKFLSSVSFEKLDAPRDENGKWRVNDKGSFADDVGAVITRQRELAFLDESCFVNWDE